MRFILIALALFSQTAFAALPPALHPLVVTAPFSFSERVFDLEPAFARAREIHKPVLLYLGADDCPPCVNYGRFLEAHITELAPTFDKFILVEMQTWLRGAKIAIRMNQRSYTIPEFKESVGDTSPGLRFPSVWMLSENGLPLKQFPSTVVKDLTTVEGNIRLLSLP